MSRIPVVIRAAEILNACIWHTTLSDKIFNKLALFPACLVASKVCWPNVPNVLLLAFLQEARKINHLDLNSHLAL